MTENYNILVSKLNAFRIRYYTFRFVKGILITFFLFVALFTLFSLAEYFVYLSSTIRKVLFYGFIIFSGLLTVHYILLPLLQMLHLLKPIDVKTSSSIIQKHFTPIKDKLLNVIELAEINDPNYSSDIVLASIDQKIGELTVFDFKKAVQFKNLRLVSFYFLLSLLIAFFIYFINSSVLTAAPQRIFHYNTHYEKPAPFVFHLLNDDLKAVKGDAFVIKAACTGDVIPQVVYINIEGNNYLMKSNEPGAYEFEMASVINAVSFHFTDLKYRSKEYTLQLLPKPGINHFDLQITPPEYTGLPKVEHDNIGDVQIPNGTQLTWNFKGIDIDTLYIAFNDSLTIGADKQDHGFQINHTFYGSTDYHVYIKNDLTESELALSYRADVIPDLYPEIKISQIEDSTQMTRYFFKGTIGDDYGFSALRFHYNISNSDSSFSLPFVQQLTDQDFYYSFDFSEVATPGSAVSYYFSVTDNDRINGFKTTTSQSFVFSMPDRKEIAASEKEQFEKLEEMLQQSEELAREIRKDLQNLRLKNMDTNTSDWEKTEMVNQIMNKQGSLEQLYDRIKKDNQKLGNFENSFQEQNEFIKEKQQQIEELLEEVFTDELKELLEEFQKLAEQFDSKKLNELTEKMNFSYEDLQKQMDRNLEMLRKMKVEQKIQSVIDEMNTLADEEERMAEEISQKSNFDQVGDQLNDHQQTVDDIQNALKEALEINQDLEKPMNFDPFEEEFNDIKESMEQSEDALDKNNRRKAGGAMQQTTEKIRNTAFSMQQMLNSNTMEQNMENLQNLRQILSNLVYLSFEQENILVEIGSATQGDPVFNDLNRRQNRIGGQSQIVRDSLYALAKRTPQINHLVNNELLAMEMNLGKVKSEMEEGRYGNARISQQFVMTAANNLALLLNEALAKLEEQMANSQPGDQNCEKPGQGKPGMSLMQQQSENLKQQLQQMIEQMKNGNSQQMSPQFGQSMMQHEMMQQMLREIMNNGSVGSEARNALQQIDALLEQNRKQLMNKQVNAEMIARQNLISSRLLDAEKAEMEREFEDERESRTAEDFYSNPVEFFEPEKRDISNVEYLNRGSFKLNNFYNSKYKQYINNIEEE